MRKVYLRRQGAPLPPRRRQSRRLRDRCKLHGSAQSDPPGPILGDEIQLATRGPVGGPTRRLFRLRLSLAGGGHRFSAEHREPRSPYRVEEVDAITSSGEVRIWQRPCSRGHSPCETTRARTYPASPSRRSGSGSVPADSLDTESSLHAGRAPTDRNVQDISVIEKSSSATWSAAPRRR